MLHWEMTRGRGREGGCTLWKRFGISVTSQQWVMFARPVADFIWFGHALFVVCFPYPLTVPICLQDSRSVMSTTSRDTPLVPHTVFMCQVSIEKHFFFLNLLGLPSLPSLKWAPTNVLRNKVWYSPHHPASAYWSIQKQGYHHRPNTPQSLEKDPLLSPGTFTIYIQAQWLW